LIDRTAAQELATKQIAGWKLPGGDVWILVDDLTREEDFGWVFFYTSKRFKETGDPHAAPVGNAPIIVDRADGSVHLTGTARPTSYYIDRYRSGRGSGTKDQASPAS
jgi:Immunity protein 35